MSSNTSSVGQTLTFSPVPKYFPSPTSTLPAHRTAHGLGSVSGSDLRVSQGKPIAVVAQPDLSRINGGEYSWRLRG